jgi:hypothetical protein
MNKAQLSQEGFLIEDLVAAEFYGSQRPGPWRWDLSLSQTEVIEYAEQKGKGHYKIEGPHRILLRKQTRNIRRALSRVLSNIS